MLEILLTLPLRYILDGFLGGALYALVQKFGWGEKEEIMRRLSMGAIAGYIVFIAGLPNSLTALSLGYVGIDAIEAIINKTKIKTIQEK